MWLYRAIDSRLYGEVWKKHDSFAVKEIPKKIVVNGVAVILGNNNYEAQKVIIGYNG